MNLQVNPLVTVPFSKSWAPVRNTKSVFNAIVFTQ